MRWDNRIGLLACTSVLWGGVVPRCTAGRLWTRGSCADHRLAAGKTGTAASGPTSGPTHFLAKTSRPVLSPTLRNRAAPVTGRSRNPTSPPLTSHTPPLLGFQLRPLGTARAGPSPPSPSSIRLHYCLLQRDRCCSRLCGVADHRAISTFRPSCPPSPPSALIHLVLATAGAAYRNPSHPFTFFLA